MKLKISFNYIITLTVPKILVQMAKTKFQNPASHLEKGLTARVNKQKDSWVILAMES